MGILNGFIKGLSMYFSGSLISSLPTRVKPCYDTVHIDSFCNAFKILPIFYKHPVVLAYLVVQLNIKVVSFISPP